MSEKGEGGVSLNIDSGWGWFALAVCITATIGSPDLLDALIAATSGVPLEEILSMQEGLRDD